MDGVVTFLLTKKADAALEFYRDVLGLQFVGDDGFALVFDMRGVMLRISRVPEFTPAQQTVLGWKTEEICAEMTRLAEKGLRFEHYPDMGQDEEGVCTFPSGDKVAWFKDTDGNLLSLSQFAATTR